MGCFLDQDRKLNEKNQLDTQDTQRKVQLQENMKNEKAKNCASKNIQKLVQNLRQQDKRETVLNQKANLLLQKGNIAESKKVQKQLFHVQKKKKQIENQIAKLQEYKQAINHKENANLVMDGMRINKYGQLKEKNQKILDDLRNLNQDKWENEQLQKQIDHQMQQSDSQQDQDVQKMLRERMKNIKPKGKQVAVSLPSKENYQNQQKDEIYELLNGDANKQRYPNKYYDQIRTIKAND